MSAREPPPPGDPTRPTEPLRGSAETAPPTEPLRGPAPPPRVPRAAPAAPPLVEERYAPPPYPPEDPWYSNPGAAFMVGLVALLLGGVIGYAIGHGNASSKPGTTAAARTVTRTVVQPKIVNHTNTVTASTVTQAPPNPANEQRRVEAEANLHKLEKENEELRQSAEGG